MYNPAETSNEINQTKVLSFQYPFLSIQKIKFKIFEYHSLKNYVFNTIYAVTNVD